MPRPSASPPGRDLPTLDKAIEIEAAFPGSGARLVEAYLRALDTEDYEHRARVNVMIADASHARIYRHLCILLGAALASGAIALGAYAVALGADVYAIAALVTPISGLAGIFVWGSQRARGTSAPEADRQDARQGAGRPNP